MSQEGGEPDQPGGRLDRLNAGERACLALVAKGKTSKQIGRELDTPPNTVDDRLRSACRKLGAENRLHAAQMYTTEILTGNSTGSDTTSRLRHEDSEIPEAADHRDKGSSAGEGDGSDDYDRDRLRRLVSLADSGGGRTRPKPSLPIATFFWGTSKLSPARRLMIILLIAFGFLIGVGTMVNGLTLLSRVFGIPGGAGS